MLDTVRLKPTNVKYGLKHQALSIFQALFLVQNSHRYSRHSKLFITWGLRTSSLRPTGGDEI